MDFQIQIMMLARQWEEGACGMIFYQTIKMDGLVKSPKWMFIPPYPAVK